jgi:hypothetical protein
MELLGRHKTPEKKPAKYIHPIVICSKNGHIVVNNIVVTKRQDLPTTKTAKVTPSAKRRKLDPQVKLPSSDNESSKSTIDSSSKDSKEEKEDDERDDESTSGTSKIKSDEYVVKVGKNQEEAVEDEDIETQQQEKEVEGSENSPLQFMNQDLFDPIITV